VTPVEFRGDLWHQKTRVPGLSCGVVCVILRLAVLVEHRLVTDRYRHRQTYRGLWLVPRMHSIARKNDRPVGGCGKLRGCNLHIRPVLNIFGLALLFVIGGPLKVTV